MELYDGIDKVQRIECKRHFLEGFLQSLLQESARKCSILNPTLLQIESVLADSDCIRVKETIAIEALQEMVMRERHPSG